MIAQPCSPPAPPTPPGSPRPSSPLPAVPPQPPRLPVVSSRSEERGMPCTTCNHVPTEPPSSLNMARPPGFGEGAEGARRACPHRPGQGQALRLEASACARRPCTRHACTCGAAQATKIATPTAFKLEYGALRFLGGARSVRRPKTWGPRRCSLTWGWALRGVYGLRNKKTPFSGARIWGISF